MSISDAIEDIALLMMSLMLHALLMGSGPPTYQSVQVLY